MQTLKKQCPQNKGNGVIMTDVNFRENEKILEFLCLKSEISANVAQ